MSNIEVIYKIEDEHWSDEKYYNQEEQKVTVTEDELSKMLSGDEVKKVEIGFCQSIEIISIKVL